MTTAYILQRKDSIDHSFLDCRFVIYFDTEAIKGFDNASNNSRFKPSTAEKPFCLTKGPHNKELVKKCNFARYYIYSCKLHDKPIILRYFVNKVLLKYKIEKRLEDTKKLPLQ